MSFVESFKKEITTINEDTFQDCAMEVFNYQYSQNPTYKEYCRYLGKTPKNVLSITKIPFVPIEFFKLHELKCGEWASQEVFLSSGTTFTGKSKHHLKDREFYHHISTVIFENFFGGLSNFSVYGLLPSYQEQKNSSLIHMVNHFMIKCGGTSGYFLENHEKLRGILENEENKVLFGVSYALLDLIQDRNIRSDNLVLIETGGMKGRRKEITREELHQKLANGYSLSVIQSEYGMTELLSQAYSKKDGMFSFPGWAKTLIRDVNDPFEYLEEGKIGGINVIDLANVDTCSFIETKDLGKRLKNGQFEVLGRFDNSDIRGCNLMI